MESDSKERKLLLAIQAIQENKASLQPLKVRNRIHGGIRLQDDLQHPNVYEDKGEER
jgi:hypothetical protein